VYFGKVEDRNIDLGAQNSDLERKVGHKRTLLSGEQRVVYSEHRLR
jgi:hypothetical protein